MILKIVKFSKTLCKVLVDEVLYAKLPCRLFVRYSKEQVITHDELNRILREIILPEATKSAVRWLGTREMSTLEVKNKLLSKGFNQDVVEQVVDYLKEHKYLDDRRFALELKELRETSRPYGRYRLKIDLERKGVPSDIIKEVLSEFNEKKALKAAVKMAQRHNKKGRALYDFLYRRGFSGDLIMDYMRENESDNED